MPEHSIIQENTRKTSLYSLHSSLGAKIVNFHNWLMPIEYRSILSEAKAVRKSCGVFDASHMGEIEITGPQAEDFCQYVLTNDISLISAGRMQYTLLCDENAGIIDDLMAYKMKDRFLLVVNASNVKQDYDWLASHIKGFEAEVKDISSKYGLIAVQGPMAESVLRENLKINLQGLKYMSFEQIENSFGKILVSRSGYTGEDGFELFVANEMAVLVWEKIFSHAEEFGITPCGLGARDILRLEMGYPLYGNDISRDTNPVEAGLFWAVKLDKPDFIGKDKIKEIVASGSKRQRIGFIMKERGMPRQNYEMFSEDEQWVGRVTSGGFSPNLNKFIGMGYVDKSTLSKSNKDILINIRNKFYKAEIVKMPFLPAKTKV